MNLRDHLTPIVDLALAEDRVSEDATEQLLPSPTRSGASLRSRQDGVWCGSGVSELVFERAGLDVVVTRTVGEGDGYVAGTVLETWEGPGSMTSVERVILNILQHLGAIATETRRWVLELADTGCRIHDTRKTTPGWRMVEKHAVACGGGSNHRLHLADAVMVKDNHLERAGSPKGTALTAFISDIVGRSGVPVNVEVESVDDCLHVARATPALILLDNMSDAQMRACVEAVADLGLERPPRLEASGGVAFDRLREIAATGVDRISAGALTQSPPRLDLGLDWQA